LWNYVCTGLTRRRHEVRSGRDENSGRDDTSLVNQLLSFGFRLYDGVAAAIVRSNRCRIACSHVITTPPGRDDTASTAARS
jgi:hypothetical protein